MAPSQRDPIDERLFGSWRPMAALSTRLGGAVHAMALRKGEPTSLAVSSQNQQATASLPSPPNGLERATAMHPTSPGFFPNA